MDTNQARFIFEVQRVSQRVAAECQYTPTRPRLGSLPTTTSFRHALATLLHNLATQLDTREVPVPVS